MTDTLTMTTDTRIADLTAEIDKFAAATTKRNLIPAGELQDFLLDIRNILNTPEMSN